MTGDPRLGVFVGAVGALAGAYALASSFFVQVWRHRRRDDEYLWFGALSGLLAVHTGLIAAVYALSSPGAEALMRRALEGLSIVSIAAVAVVVRFALRYGRVPWERRAGRAVALASLPFIALVVVGHWYDGAPHFEAAMAGPPALMMAFRWPAKLFNVAVAAALLGVVVLLERRRRLEPSEGWAAVAGGAVVVATCFHDMFVLGSGSGAPALLPVGFMAFVWGVGSTLITRYGRMATSLQSRTRELALRTEELDAATTELERTHADVVKQRQLAVVGELASVIAAQVQHPIRDVRKSFAALELEVIDPERLADVETKMTRLRQVVDDLLDYVRPLAPQPASTHVEGFLDGCAQALREAGGPSFELALAPELPAVPIDAPLMRHALENLVRNAATAGGDAPVEIRARREADQVLLEVVDRGPGMSPERIGLALTPFFTTSESGTGLGLPIADRIVQAHGGTLRLDSGPDGTTATVALPIADAD